MNVNAANEDMLSESELKKLPLGRESGAREGEKAKERDGGWRVMERKLRGGGGGN